MSHDEQKDWLDELLEAPAPHIPDAGFTASVMARVTARRRSPGRMLLQLVALASAAAAFVLFGGGGALLEVFMPLGAPFSAGLGPLALAALVLVGAAWWPLALVLDEE